MRLPDGFVEQVRAAASIVQVVSTWVTLKKAGASYKARCPFHQEKTPSFQVSEARGMFYCFGCQQGGDVFKFVMLQEKLTFPEAVRKVAELSGIPVPAEETGAEAGRKERLHALLERALRLYRDTLLAPSGSAARAYLERRGIGDETRERFELGLTPEGWEGTARPLLRAGYRPEELVAAGLAIERPGRGGVYDRFRDRVVFPIRNASGRLVAFGGRALAPGPNDAKYLNSPETELYKKGELLYALPVAREAMRKSGHAVLVEGYMDAVSLHQAGVGEAVASLGTSLTDGQARLLSRHVPRVYVAYDGDPAGRRAAARALSVLLPHRLDAAVVVLDPGQDPDDLVRAGGGESFRARLGAARPPIPFLVELAREADPDAGRTPAGRLRLVNAVLPTLALLADPLERILHASALAEAAGIDDRAVLDAVRRAAGEKQGEVAPPPPRPAAAAALNLAETVLLLGLLGGEEGWRAVGEELEPEDWEGLRAAPLVAAAVAAWRSGSPPTPSGVLAGLPGEEERRLLSQVLVETQAVTPRQVRAAFESLRRDRLERELRGLQSRIVSTAGQDPELLERKLELSRRLAALREPETERQARAGGEAKPGGRDGAPGVERGGVPSAGGEHDI